MSLAEVLPAVQALTRAEKAELVRIVNAELAQAREDQLATLLSSGIAIHAGYGLFDEKSCEGAAVLLNAREERKKAE